METRVEVDIQFPAIPLIPLNELEAFRSSLPPIPPGQCCLRYLSDLSWATTGLNHAIQIELGRMPPITATILSAYQGHALVPSDMVAYLIWERTNYIHAYRRCGELYLDPGNVGMNPEQVRISAVERYVREVCDGQDWATSVHSSPERESAAKRVLHRGMRWQELVEGVGCLEAVLVHPNAYIGPPSGNNIGNIVDRGTDEEFASFKLQLVSPECGFRDYCLRLSGLANMILDLAESRVNGPLRAYLAGEISRRIGDVFPDSDSPEMTAGNPIQRPLSLAPMRLPMNRSRHAIAEIFGFMGPWPPGGNRQLDNIATTRAFTTTGAASGGGQNIATLFDAVPHQTQEAGITSTPSVFNITLRNEPIFNGLCARCREIFRVAATFPARGGPGPGDGTRVPFHNMQALMSSAMDGCHLCNLLMCDMSPHLVQYNINDLVRNPRRVESQIVAVIPSERWMGDNEPPAHRNLNTPLITLEEFNRRAGLINSIPLCQLRFRVRTPSVPSELSSRRSRCSGRYVAD